MEPSFARQTRIWFTEPSFRKTRKLLSFPRPKFSRVVRWLTGHAYLGLQNFRCGLEPISTCRLCGQVPERADHLLLECPRLINLRESCFKTWVPSRNPRWEVDWIAKFVESPPILRLESREDWVATGMTTTKTSQADRKLRNQRARETGADTRETDGSTGTIPEDVAWFWQRAHAWG